MYKGRDSGVPSGTEESMLRLFYARMSALKSFPWNFRLTISRQYKNACVRSHSRCNPTRLSGIIPEYYFEIKRSLWKLSNKILRSTYTHHLFFFFLPINKFRLKNIIWIHFLRRKANFNLSQCDHKSRRHCLSLRNDIRNLWWRAIPASLCPMRLTSSSWET